MHLFIKNMVCPRCISTVEHILQQQHLRGRIIGLGEIELHDPLTPEQYRALNDALHEVGFELLDDQRKQLIEKVKNLLIQKVQSGNVEEHFSVSKFVTENIYKDYSSISKLFSEVEGITVEQFFILQKIEKTKEWLMYKEQSLSQIAFLLGYSSTQHLSTQFKRITGMTPSQFRQRGSLYRKPIDQVKD